MAPKLSKTRIRFDQLCKEIDHFEGKVEECESDDQNLCSVLKSTLKATEERLINVFSEFANKESDDNFDSYLRYRDTVLKLLVELENKNTTKIEKEIRVESKQSLVKLPKFEIPHFYGDSETWISFKELFNSSILENKQLSDIEKLQYLQSSVKGNALKLIRGFSLKKENLEHCWELLCNRFENKRQLALSQINKIFSVKIYKANNSKSLLELIDTCNEAIRNLKTLGLESNSLSDLIFIHFMLSKLDDSLKHRWELSLEGDQVPDLETFRCFIERESRSVNEEKQSKSESKGYGRSGDVRDRAVRKNVVVNNAVFKSNKLLCPVCNKESHSVFKCSEFQKMNTDQRWNVVKTKKLCSNCLRGNHFVARCVIDTTCKYCNLRHHSTLHVEKENPAPHGGTYATQDMTNVNAHNLADNSNVQSNESSCFTGQTFHENCQTLLSTAVINVKSNSGKLIACRAMIDSASQKSLISKDCCRKLSLPLKSTNHRISGINNLVAETAFQEVSLKFSPHFGNESFQVEALVVSQITTTLPNFKIPTFKWPHIEGLNLADPQYYISRPVDILIGADLFAHLIIGETILGPKGSPSAINSRLGWILSGIIFTERQAQRSSISCHAVTEIDSQLRKFWELESIPNSNQISSSSEDTYTRTTSRTASGRYVVDLPFSSKPILGNTRDKALRRLYSLENKLRADPILKKQYVSFMQEYIQLNHMEPVPGSEINLNQDHFYLPHHGVLKEDSTTTKLRVVFDASATGSEGRSLNDFLEVGPKLQPDIFKLLLQFRTHPIAFSSDIEKMFRQILVNPSHTDFQRILWRFHINDPITTYRLLTVTYGTACAPFLAIRTLHQLAHDNKDLHPEAAQVIRDHIYVDDVLSGSNSVPEARHLINELNEVMKSGGFTLRKWSCNVPNVISHLPDNLKSASNDINIQEDHTVKILGLVWNSSKDILQVRISEQKPVNTKRELLSVIASIFDPLGFLSPTTVSLKIMLQDLWKDKIPWDEQIPCNILNSWDKFNSQISFLKSIQIPRYLQSFHASDTQMQLHGFCDGSSKAYAAVAYLRVITPTGEIFTNFIASKTRINPIKSQTLPRIELCSALLLSELCAIIVENLPMNFDDIFCWTDSQIVLCWIHSPPKKGNSFVLNRVNRIHTLVPLAKWQHIPGVMNPADCASRGILPRNLLNHSLWWNGPPWLSSNEPIPTPFFEPPLTELDQPIEILNHLTESKSFPDFLLKFSKFSKLSRVIAWCRRFVYNAKHPDSKVTGLLSALEISESIQAIVKVLQFYEFPTELKLLQSNKPLPTNSKLLPLNVFLDSSGIIRVGGRLSQHQSLSYDKKYPMLLPKNHFFTKLLIRHVHEQNLHAGTQLVLSLIRQQYWFVCGRSIVRQELHKCVLCKRLKSQSCQQLMGNLPKDRITPVRPFAKVGVDFAGPCITKPNLTRSKVRIKSYIAVFICMCTKAVHLELVSDLSSQTLLAAFRRFIARRGLPSDVYSDNGKNFIGLSNQLKQLFKLLKEEAIQNFVITQGIKWHFIPPYAPHFGGLWEAAVKLTKNHLLRACKSSVLTFEELTTLLCQIESCINSRPLVPLSTDPSDPRALTPGHFLIGAPLLEIPEPSCDVNVFHLNERWNLVQRAKNQFWCRWSRDYLQHLQQRPKWTNQRVNLQIGDLVVVNDRFSSPLQWKLGRILKTFLGPDNLVRVVLIKTAEDEIKRPISKVHLILPGREDVRS